MTARKLSADFVYAWAWAMICEQKRGALCACASISTTFALLEWYELPRDAQAALGAQIADVIESNASRQRAEYAPEKVMLDGIYVRSKN